ncbi:MAG: hypothetical protein U0838_06385 [Chloroflexota bacterium]
MTGQDDLALLRRFEPVLRFTEGELFFPSPVEGYVARCDLLTGTSARDRRVVIPEGELDIERLAAAGDAAPDEVQFLRFVQKPLNPLELARWRQRSGRPSFHAPGRLARVGLPARLLDAGLVLSLLVRGRVPGGTAAAAQIKYDAMRAADPRVSYHGRVIRQDGWVVLQYLFFYVMNDWRSTFSGANDHEADWEQAFVICEERADGSVDPVWFAAAAHDEKGADLRRRWDDPRLERQGDHVVVYPGAGSHATYMERGEYIMRLPLPGERLADGVLGWFRTFWRDTLNQPDPGDLLASLKRAVSVPFVDYARGDGLAVGPGQQVEWSPVLVSDADPWVHRYRGLWGLDTRDRMAGERAPAGPKYTRTGAIRQSWNDPLSFTGLSAVPTPSRLRELVVARIAHLRDEEATTRGDADALASSLPALQVEVAAIDGVSGLEGLHARRSAELHEGEAKLATLRTTTGELHAAATASETWLERWDSGWRGDPRSHLTHAAIPEPPDTTRRRVFAETWAALSVGVLVIALAVILWFHLLPWGGALALLVVGYLAIESFAQRRFELLLLRVTVLLAAVSTVLLAWAWGRELVLGGLAILGVLILLDNVRELFNRS